ncbi:MAG: hypothetical protein ACF8K1_12845 [Phycisphaerales bacterium JB047]
MTDQPRRHQANRKTEPDPFYVGYLPTPAEHQRTVHLFIALLIIWATASGIILVLTQRDPGRAAWNNSNERTWTGVFIEHPYPMLISDDPQNPSPILIVSMGKKGAHDRLHNADCHRVSIRGYELQREGRHLIELSDAPEAIQIGEEVEPHACPEVTILSENPVELTGEIIDGKCYLGAMKPGDGIGHRSCAILCLRGGLPPMFAAESEHGEILYPLLIVDGSTHLNEACISKVACRVRIRGRIGVIAGMPVFDTTSAQIVLASGDSDFGDLDPMP